MGRTKKKDASDESGNIPVIQKNPELLGSDQHEDNQVGRQIIGHDWRYLYLDEIAVKHSHNSREKLIGHTLVEIYPGIEQTEFYTRLKQCMETHQSFQTDNEFIFADGSHGWYKLNIESVPEGIVILSLDITERKLIDNYLKATEENYQFLSEKLPFGYVITDSTGQIIQINPHARKFYEYSTRDIIGKNVFDLMPDSIIKSLKIREMVSALISGERWHDEIEVIHKDNQQKWLDISVFPQVDIWNKVLRGHVVLIDITQRKQARLEAENIELKCTEIFNNVSNCIVVYQAVENGQDFIVINFNKAAEKVERIAKEEVVGRRVTDIFPGVDEMGLLDVFRKVWQTGIPEFHPVSQYKDRRIIGWRENFVFKLSNGEIIAVYDDVSERKRKEQTTLKQEEQYRLLVENSNDAILLTAPDGRIFSANPAACKMLGRSEKEICQLGRNGIVDQNDPNLADTLEERSRTGKAKRELTFIRKDGAKLEGEVSSVIFTDGFGETRTSMIVHDITERIRTQEIIISSEEKYRTLVDTCPDGIIRVTIDGIVTFASERAYELFSHPAINEVIGQSMFKWVAPDNLERMASNFKKTLAQENVVQNEYKLLNKEGEHFWVETNSTTIKDSKGNPVGLVVVLRDITLRMKAEEELIKEHEFLDSIIENTPNAMWISNSEGTIIRMNQALRDLLNVADEEILGKYNVLKDSQIVEQGFSILVKSVFEEGRTVNFPLDYYTEKEIQVKPQQSQHKILDVMISAITNQNGKVMNAICQLKDITEPVLAEQALTRERENFRNSLDTSPMGIQIFNRRGELVYVNQTMLGMWGYDSVDQLRTIPVEKVFTPESAKLVRQMFRENKSEVPVEPRELTMVCSNGQLRDVRSYTKELLWNGETCVQTIYEDITEWKRMEQTLRDSEERFRIIFNISTVGKSITSPDGGLLQVNSAFGKMLGYTIEEMQNLDFVKITHPNDIKESRECIRRLIDNELYSYRMEKRYLHKNGSIVWADVSTTLLRENNGKPRYFITSISDITERKKIEQVLKRNEQRLKEAQVAGRISDWEFDVTTQKISWSDEMFELYERDKALGPPSVEEDAKYYSPEETIRIKEYAQQALSTSLSSQYDVLVHLPGGKTKFFSNTLRPITDQNGQVEKLSGTVQDITDRKRAEDTVLLERTNYHNSLDTSPLGIEILNIKAELVYTNQTILDMWGYASLDQLKKIPINQAFAPSSVDLIRKLFKERRIGIAPPQHELAIICADGQLKDVRVYSKETNWNGEICIQLLYEDITESKKMELGIRKLNDTLKLIRNINQLIVRIDNEEELLRKGCEELVRNEDYPLAWIGFLQENSFDVLPVAKAGKHTDYLNSLKMTWDDSPTGMEPSGITIKTGKPQILSDITTDTRFRPWHEFAESKGFKSSITLPLLINKKVIGILNIFSELYDAFRESELSLFIELAQDLSLGIEKIRAREEQAIAQQSLENEAVRRRILIDQSRDGIVLLEQDGMVYDTNQRFAEMIGYTQEETRNLKVWDWEYQLSPETTLKMLQTVDEKGDHFESKHKRKDGSIYDVEISSNAAVFGGKKLIFCVCRNITERKKGEEELLSRALLLDASTDSILLYDLEGNITFANEAMYRSQGMTRQQLTHMDIIDRTVISPDKWRTRIQGIDQKRNLTYELERIDTNQIHRFVEVQAQLVRIGTRDLVLSVARDITARKKADEELRNRERQYRELAESIADMFFAMNGNLKFTYWNHASEKFTGMTSEEVIGKSFHDIFPDSPFSQRINGLFIQSIVTGNPQHFTAKFPMNENITQDLVVYPTKDGISVFARDITEQEKLHEVLVESEERLRVLFEEAPDAYFLYDLEGKIIDGNHSAVTIVGLDRDAFIGKSFTELKMLSSDEDVYKFQKILNENIAGYPTGQDELHLVRNDGKVIDVEISTYPTHINNQQLVLSIIRDISERKKMQENLMITDRLASIGELASGMAHELNNPLTTVIGIAEILLEKKLPEDIKEDMTFMCKEARRTAEVAKNMLTFARKHPIAKSMVSVNEIISKTLEIRAYEHKVNNINVFQNLAEKLPDINADQFQLQQVFLNIIINAEYFMKETHNSGILTITTGQVGSMVKISITDNGPGIQKENINHVFDPFFTTKPVGKGTGLGLSICHGIISEHNGRIYVESEPGNGANFIIELPISSQSGNN